MIDFSDCTIKYTKIYDGLNGKKLAIFYKDELYMLKFPKDNHITGGYASSTINEHISSKIFKSLGFETQDTILGYYDDKVVVACKDFEIGRNRLFNFGKIKNSVLSVSGSSFSDTDLDETLKIIDEQKLIDKDRLKEFYWDMFIADTFIANFNRHNENWGILVNEQNDTCKIAPIYDCGSSLYPKLNNQDIQKYLSHKGSFNDLILNQTTSAVTRFGKKTNPQNFLFSNLNNDILMSLKKINLNINLEKINRIIDEIEIISSDRKEFYKKVIKERKEIILDVAYEKYLSNAKNIYDDEKSLFISKEIMKKSKI
ncbi:hypothetical protein CBLAS_1040 [Campylobacter blaseri]|uniref:HipA-like C-terminal domain-containing protein n=1 Tax=Campylobacter blaseri TaxID=2042961 RepID=A0A2P8QYH5_9BACT|nr:HipA domain-containing protein [Campylobacter blaseri]PSM51308.1 hypothetical protein CQ405_08745 [Campylobacter blaseri]PSM52452.1 hypothetical protein CRN67_08750 [Campylobacter blaseri]QKF86218.1 hypothetical protein CBLAS_1040 [Campylobacter blaseri]